MISRCDSAAIVPNTSELLPEPETPVNTVSRRFGISMLTSLRLFTRAPCTRIRSWLSATCSAGDCVSFLVAVLIVSPSVRRGPPSRCSWRRLAGSTSLAQNVLFSFGVVAQRSAVYLIGVSTRVGATPIPSGLRPSRRRRRSDVQAIAQPD